MKYLYLLPMGDINEELLEHLGKNIQKQLKLQYRLLNSINVPVHTKNNRRNQYNASGLLKEISLLDFYSIERLLCIIDVDLYADDLSFIFGQAESPGRNAIVSTKRLNPEFYGQKFNQDVFFERVLKESLHELGHTLNLSHCPDKNCVMYYSNVLSETDYKKAFFCRRCSKLLNIYNS